VDFLPQGEIRCLSDIDFPFLILISPIPPPRFKESLDIPIILTMTAPKQHKQRYYYIFWSIATVSVVIGQIYVATGYRALAQALRMSLT
jgi:hypothetical protein